MAECYVFFTKHHDFLIYSPDVRHMLVLVFCYYGSCCMDTFMLIIFILSVDSFKKVCTLACDYYSNYKGIFIDPVTYCLSNNILYQIFEVRFTVVSVCGQTF